MSAASSRPSSLIPLVLGVTGHRDLRPEDVPALEARVQEVFDKLAAAHPATPLLLLSPLAEGADRLVARVALRRGLRLIGPLPLPRALYELDFATPESRKEFADLLAAAEPWFELPLAEGNTLENIREPGDPRDGQYKAGGLYVARHSHVLLALWDGVKSGKTGGTSEMVELCLSGMPAPDREMRVPFIPAEAGPVLHLVTPHVENPKPSGESFALRQLFPSSEAQAGGASGRDVVFDQLDTFNHDALVHGAALAEAIRLSQNQLLPDDRAGGLPASLLSLRRHYALADALAIHFQNKWSRIWKWLCGLGVAAVLLLSSHDNLAGPARPGRKVIFLCGYLAIAAFGWVMYRRAEDASEPRAGRSAGRRIPGFKTRHLDYRALAEGLRVQFFWRLAGLSDEVADYYLEHERSDAEWVRQAIRACSALAARPAPQSAEAAGGSRAERGGLVAAHWISDQRGYFQERVGRLRGLRKTLRRSAKSLLAGALSFVTLLVVTHFLHLSGCEVVCEWGVQILIFLTGAALALSGALEIYAEKMALSDLAKQYEQMRRIFDSVEKDFSRHLAEGRFAPAERLLREAGRAALKENAEWVHLHRERHLEMRLS